MQAASTHLEIRSNGLHSQADVDGSLIDVHLQRESNNDEGVLQVDLLVASKVRQRANVGCASAGCCNID